MFAFFKISVNLADTKMQFSGGGGGECYSSTPDQFQNIVYGCLASRQSEEPKKNSVGIFEYILASMLKVLLNM